MSGERKFGGLIASLIVGVYGWLFLAGLSDKPAEALSHYVPGWVAMLTWASWLILAPIGRGPLHVPEILRVSLAVLFLISCLLLPVAVRFNLVATALVGAVFIIEQLWLIPLWKAKWKRSQESR
jgi:hypothetical protein